MPSPKYFLIKCKTISVSDFVQVCLDRSVDNKGVPRRSLAKILKTKYWENIDDKLKQSSVTKLNNDEAEQLEEILELIQC